MTTLAPYIQGKVQRNGHLFTHLLSNGWHIDEEHRTDLRYFNHLFTLWEPGSGGRGYAAYKGGAENLADTLAIVAKATSPSQQ